MNKFSLSECSDRHGEVFDLAAVEPVLLTKKGRPSHVILSARAYTELTEKLRELEDAALGEAAERAVQEGKLVGSRKFTDALTKLANG